MYAFDVCALMIFATLLVTSVMSDRVKTRQVMYYRLICACAGASSFFEITKLLLLDRGDTGVTVEFLLYAVTTLYFVFHLLTAVFVFKFVFALVLVRVRAKTTFTDILLAYGPYLASLAVILANLANTGILFWYEITPQGFVYHRGSLLIVCYISALIYITNSVFALWYFRQVVSTSLRSSLYGYFMCFITGLFLQTVVPGLYVEQFFMSISCLLVYITIQRTNDFMDPESGALSRRLFLTNVMSLISVKQPFTVVTIKLDNNVFIEDSLGEDMVGELPRIIVRYLKGFHDNADIFRYKEDTYILLMKSGRASKADNIMKDVERQFDRPWQAGDFLVKPGIAMWKLSYPEYFDSVEKLVHLTGFMSNPENRKGAVILDPEQFDLSENEHRIELEKRIFEQYDSGILEVVPMNVVRAGDHRHSGYVPRLLMNDHRGNPVDLYPTDLQNKQVKNLDKLDYYIIEDMLARLSESKDERMVPVAVRVSKDFLLKEDMPERLRGMLSTYGIESRMLLLGISDDVYSSMTPDEMRQVRAVAKKGVRLFLFSFGIGYSQLVSLLDSPFEYISVGYRTARMALEKPELRKALKAVSDAFHSAGKKVLAIGVNEEESEMIAEEYGADYLCGQLYDGGDAA